MNKPEFIIYRVRVCPPTRHGTGAPIVDKCIAIPNTPYAPGRLQERYEKLYDGLNVSLTVVNFEDETVPTAAPPVAPKESCELVYTLRLKTSLSDDVVEVDQIQRILRTRKELRALEKSLIDHVGERMEKQHSGQGQICQVALNIDDGTASYNLFVPGGVFREEK